MRPLSFEERAELVARSRGLDLLDFVHQLQDLGGSHQELLAVLLCLPQPTDADTLVLRNLLAEHGTELTPSETVEAVEQAACKIRNMLRAMGVRDIPDSDVELFEKFCAHRKTAKK